jgi:hypothetical protein
MSEPQMSPDYVDHNSAQGNYVQYVFSGIGEEARPPLIVFTNWLHDEEAEAALVNALVPVTPSFTLVPRTMVTRIRKFREQTILFEDQEQPEETPGGSE